MDMLDLRPHIPGDQNWNTCGVTAELADELAPCFAELDAWKNIQCSPAQIRSMLLETGNGQFCQVVLQGNDRPMAAFIVWPNWFVGPYLQLLAVLPLFQRQGIGTAVLSAFEQSARSQQARNLWVATSTDNEPAQRLYRRHGFTAAAAIEGLVSNDETEILFRKRLY